MLRRAQGRALTGAIELWAQTIIPCGQKVLRTPCCTGRSGARSDLRLPLSSFSLCLVMRDVGQVRVIWTKSPMLQFQPVSAWHREPGIIRGRGCIPVRNARAYFGSIDTLRVRPTPHAPAASGPKKPTIRLILPSRANSRKSTLSARGDPSASTFFQPKRAVL
jgi:hypothetical protein